MSADGTIKIATSLETTTVERGMGDLTKSIAGWAASAASAWQDFQTAVIGSGVAFNNALAPIEARTGMSTAEMEKLQYAFRDMSKAGVHTATDIAYAFSKVAVEGRTVSESTELMNKAMLLADSTGTDLTSSTKFLGLALMKTNSDVDQAHKYVNTFSQVVASSGMSLGKLQDAVITIAPTMNMTGASIQEMSGALATMYTGGMQGIAAGRGIQQVVSQLATPTEAAYLAMKDLGISVFDSAGAMRPLNDILLDTIDALEGTGTQQEKVNYLSSLFSTNYAQQTIDILMSNTDAWQDNIAAMYNANYAFEGVGTAMHMAEIMNTGYTTSLGKVKNAFEEVMINIWRGQEVAVLGVLDSVGEGLWDVAEALQPGGALHGGLQALQATATTVFNVFASLVDLCITALRALFSTIETNSIGNAFDPLKQSLRMIRPLVEDLIARFATFAEKLINLTVIAGAGFLYGLLAVLAELGSSIVVAVTQNMSRLLEAFDRLVESCIRLVASTGSAGDSVSGLGNAFSNILGAIGSVVSILVHEFISAIIVIINAVTNVIDNMREWNEANGWLDRTLGALGAVVGSIASTIGTLLVIAMRGLADVTASVITSFGSLIQYLPIVLQAFAGLADLIGTILVAAFFVVVEVIKFMADNLLILNPLIIAVTAAFIGMKVVATLTSMLVALNGGLAALIGVAGSLTAAKMALIAQFTLLKANLATLIAPLAALAAKFAFVGTALAAMKVQLLALKAGFIAFKAPIMLAVAGLALLVIHFDDLHPVMQVATVAIIAFVAAAITIHTLLPVLAAAKTAFLTLGTSITAISFASLKTAIAGVITTIGAKVTALGGLSSAFVALKAVMLANPIIAAGAAIAGVAAAAIYLRTRTQELGTEFEMFNNITEKNVVTQARIMDAMAQSADSYKDNSNAIRDNNEYNLQLIETIGRLSAKQHLNAAEMHELQNNIDELNKAVPALGLSFDTTAMALNASTEAMHLFVTASNEGDRLNAMAEERNRLKQEEMTLNRELENSIGALTTMQARQTSGTVLNRTEQGALINAIRETEIVVENYRSALEQNIGSQEQLNSSINDQVQAYVEAQNAADAMSQKLEEQRATVHAVEAAFQVHYNTVTNTFSQMATASDMSLATLTANLLESAEATMNYANRMDEFGDKIERLERKAAEGTISEGLVNQFREMGPQALPLLDEVLYGTQDALYKLNYAYDMSMQAISEATKSELRTFGDGIDEMINSVAEGIKTNSAINIAMEGAVDSGVTAMLRQVKESDLPGVGSSLNEGVAGGIDGSTNIINESGRNSILGFLDSLRATAGINSPARETMIIGGFLVDGLLQGIQEKIAALGEVATNAISAFMQPWESIDLRSIGSNAMSGLIAGLREREDEVRQVATEIASVVQTAMQSYLQINSPSRLMLNTVGIPIALGIAGGITEGTPIAVQAATEMSSAVHDACVAWVDQYAESTSDWIDYQSATWDEYLELHAEKTLFRNEIDQAGVDLRLQLAENEHWENLKLIEERLDREVEAARETNDTWNKELEERVRSTELKKALAEEEFWATSQWMYARMDTIEEITWAEFEAMSKLEVGLRYLADFRKTLDEDGYISAVDWMDKRMEHLGMTVDDELLLLDMMLRELDLSGDERVEIEQRVFDRQKAIMMSVYTEQSRIISRMIELEDEYTNALEKRTDALFATFNMLDKIQYKDTQLDKNVKEVERLTNAYEQNKLELADISVEIDKARLQHETHADLLKEKNRLQKLLDDSTERSSQKHRDNREALNEVNGALRDAERAGRDHEKLLGDQIKKTMEMETTQQLLTQAIETSTKSQTLIMASNLLEQTKAMEQWAKDLERLVERGISEGLLGELRRMGPESANLIAQMAQSSNAELGVLTDAFENGYKQARSLAEQELQALRDSTSNEIRMLAGELNYLAYTEYAIVGSSIITAIVQGIESNNWQISNSLANAARSAVESAQRELERTQSWNNYQPDRWGVSPFAFSADVSDALYDGANELMYAVSSLVDVVEDLGYIRLDDIHDEVLDLASAFSMLDTEIADLMDSNRSMSLGTSSTTNEVTEIAPHLEMHVHLESSGESYADAYSVGREFADATSRELRNLGISVLGVR